jgi:hypothetical protein
MSSTIHTSDIKNVHIFNESSKELKLCKKHREKLCHDLADQIDDLVASRLFQTRFSQFLPASDEEVNVRIRITGDRIRVQELDQNGRNIGRAKTVDLSEAIEGLEDEDLDEAQSINQEILEKASGIYRQHLRERGRRHGHSVSPLRGRASYVEPKRRERHREASRDRSESSSPVRHRHHTAHEAHEPRRRHPSAPSSSRGQNPDAIEPEMVLGRVPPPVPRTNPTPPTRVEEAQPPVLTATPAPTPTPTPIPRIVEPPRPEANEQIRELQSQKGELQQRLAQVTAENELLKALPPEEKISVSQADYKKMINISQALSQQENAGSRHFPVHLKEEFMALPENIRNAIYYQTYLLIDPLEAKDPWPIGQRLFEGNTYDDSASNESRAHVVRHFLMHTLATEFAQAEWKRPPQELLNRFYQLPEMDQRAVYTQLEYIQPKGSDYRGPGHAFAGQDHLSVTNRERSEAIHRAINDRIAEYHRYHYRQTIEEMKNLFRRSQEEAIADS